MQTYAYGFPRLGSDQEYKKAIESFWCAKIGEKKLIKQLFDVESQRLGVYQENVDTFPIGEFTYYDNMLDTACIFGVHKFKNINGYFEYARGAKALELKKYFNTNYHYLTPVINKNAKFTLSWNKPLDYFNKFTAFKNQPLFLIGPYTFLRLSQVQGNFIKTFDELCAAYKKLFKELKNHGVSSLHIEEPAFCCDVEKKEVDSIIRNYKNIIPQDLKVNLMTYYESVDFLSHLYDLPVDGIGVDFIAGVDNLKHLKRKKFPRDKKLICGIVDGRSPRRIDVGATAKYLDMIRKTAKLKEQNIVISNSCPLQHLPISLNKEDNVTNVLSGKLSFATERLYELKLINELMTKKSTKAKQWSFIASKKSIKKFPKSFDTLTLTPKDFLFRKKHQRDELKLPLFPITTIGSFPQDKQIRKMISDFENGDVQESDYDKFIRSRIHELVNKEEEIGLDVLVGGEFERTDMVEFFAQKLDGFLTTDQGWVISYGTMVCRPPIVCDKIERVRPLTLKETFYAQSITSKIVKGVLTGPITILSRAYVLRDDPLHEVAFELAHALNAEVQDLADKGIKIIQIDEPAIKELAPLKEAKADFYYSWAVRAFNIAAHLSSDIQVHTHLCYSEFSDILKWILRLNFDVISIESARSRGRILDAFKKYKFTRAIGPGVWDTHSNVAVKDAAVIEIIDKSVKIFDIDSIWVNPDCGLKTREWPETVKSLKKIVKIAKNYRKKYQNKAKRFY
ncbi:MAG: 5-methyltetrahydropteroyltriglutamate--homocysteine S-methyltransferase [Candidatus Omnitrophica bacterium]|nr:5-methyltetrahydropteroyltriglutamate--homocysteine S-methyltransferase [Candidatus Omnitrophota bacterium]